MKTSLYNKGTKIRGVNLGGWLVLEKWMTPSLFDGLDAVDETTWCIELGTAAVTRLLQHWNTFITREDFAWLADVGINAVRIPIGHWIFGPPYPYHRAYGSDPFPYVEGGIDILDRAFDWAEEFDLAIVLDLHAAPGCQNGFDNGGIKDVCEWHTDQIFIEHSLLILEKLAQRYCGRRVLHGIQVLNEPRWDIETPLLIGYNVAGYERIRRYCRAEDVAVVFHDAFRSHKEYAGAMPATDYDNTVYDIHRYQCFVQEDIDLDIFGHIDKTITAWKQESDDIATELGLWTYVGEWSLGLDLKAVSIWAPGSYNNALERLDSFQLDTAYRAYGAAQLLAFEKYLGWFFWSYKTETAQAWSFRDCVENGWLPSSFRFDES